MDVLSDVLGSLRLRSGIFAHTELVAPAVLRGRVRDRAVARPICPYHVFVRGGGWLEDVGREAPGAKAGGVILVAPGIGVTLRGSLKTEARKERVAVIGRDEDHVA